MHRRPDLISEGAEKRRWCFRILLTLLLLALIAIMVLTAALYRLSKSVTYYEQETGEDAFNDQSVKEIVAAEIGERSNVVSGHQICESIGNEILGDNGSAVDAAVAMLFCQGVVEPHRSGLGGGFVMLIFVNESKEVISLGAREVAPKMASSYMFDTHSANLTGVNKSQEVEESPVARHSTSLRWSAMFRRAVVSLTRRSNDPNSIKALEDVIDDESERSLPSPAPGTPRLEGKVGITCHIEICQKMFYENLRMIDYLRLSVSSHEMQNPVQADGAMDVSAKIYRIRVDDVHAHGLKLASDIGRSAHKSNDDGNDDEALDGEQQGAKKKRARCLSTSAKSKIVKDPMSLVGDIVKLDTAIFQTHTAGDTSLILNLFTYRMPLNHEGYKFMPLSDEKPSLNSDDEEDEKQEDPQLFPFTIPTLNNLPIIGSLPNFQIDEWDPNENSSEEKPANFNNEVVYDEEDIPVSELDGSLHNIFEDAAAVELEHPNKYAGRNEKVAQLQNFQPGQHNVRLTEYSFVIEPKTNNNKFITQVWAGPSHWKLKRVRPALTRFSGWQEKQFTDAKLSRKPRFQPEADQPDFSKFKKVKRNFAFPKIHTATNITGRKGPQYELLHKQVCVPFKNYLEEFIDGGEISSYQYDSANDTNYCLELLEVSNGSNGPDEFVDEHIKEVQQNFIQDKLMDCPELVPKSHILYALHAERVDMKKLKSNMWTSLSKDKNKSKIEKTMFSTVYEQLDKRLSQQMREDMFCPMMLFTLLHLANELNLRLTGQPDLKDIIIEQEGERKGHDQFISFL